MGKASDRRLGQVKSLLQRTLDELIREELKDPRIGIFSITEIHLSRDLSFADVFIAVVGGGQATDDCVGVLNRAAPLLWNRLREATDLRSVPKLRFNADHRGAYADEMFNLLEGLRTDEEAADEDVMDQNGQRADNPDDNDSEVRQ